jgi:predicted  nucleic acid-binding Zn-ribbon protein
MENIISKYEARFARLEWELAKTNEKSDRLAWELTIASQRSDRLEQELAEANTRSHRLEQESVKTKRELRETKHNVNNLLLHLEDTRRIKKGVRETYNRKYGVSLRKIDEV